MIILNSNSKLVQEQIIVSQICIVDSVAIPPTPSLSPQTCHREESLENMTAATADVEKFLQQEVQHCADVGARSAGNLTIPVSADRCCDWKKTASLS